MVFLSFHTTHKDRHKQKEVGEEEGDDDDVERLRRILTCVPCEDDVVTKQNHQMREEETACIAKGVSLRKRGHECDVCEKVFVSPSKLAIHMRMHTKEKPYECDVCDRGDFATSRKFETPHAHCTRDEKPYECDVCEKRFSQSSNLQNHARNVH